LIVVFILPYFQLCSSLSSKLEALVHEYGKLDREVKQQRLTSSEYKQQAESQTKMTRELKERVDTLRQELSESLTVRLVAVV